MKFPKNYFVALSVILCVIASVVAPSQLFAKVVFSDIATSPYKTSIEYVAAKGAVKGYSDGTFRPTSLVNRAELATILVSSKVPFDQIKDRKNCFKDVNEEWYAPYVCYAKEHGIVSGYPNGTFMPSQQVKMAEAYLMASKRFAFVLPQVAPSEPWYKPAVEFVHANTFFSKFSFLPSTSMTREEMALLMHQFFLIEDGTKKIAAVRENFSSGCGKVPPSTAPSKSVIGGVLRNYITYVPSGYSKNTPIKIVFAFHGRTNSNSDVRKYYGIEKASEGKAIIVYPAGLRSGNGYSWSNAGDSATQLRDFPLFDQLLEEFESAYCINKDEVFVVGHSLGAWFTNSLACARGDVIRGIGSVGGGTTVAQCKGPVAALIMHNPKDNLVPFSQGVTARDQLLKQNQCGSTSFATSPSALACQSYRGCGDYAPVTWCPHREDNAYWDGSYYPHTWPRDAGKEIWKFFSSL